jgi:amphi-Trp domain-containing protein
MKKDRDIEKGYTTKQMVVKLRRLADCLEKDKPFRIQIASERLTIPSSAIFNIEHEREGHMEEVEFQFKWKINCNYSAKKPKSSKKRLDRVFL